MPSTHGAYIGRIKVFPHPNADNLVLGKLGGFQLIVSNQTENDQLGVFFSSDLRVSSEYATANNLRRVDGGFFEDNLRVRAINLRGEKSEGYFAPLESLAFTGVNIKDLKEGMMFTELNKVPICEKYIPKTTLQKMGRANNARKAIAAFPKHYDTEQLGYYIQNIPVESMIWFTLKLHGTSGRTGYVQDENQKLSWWEKNILRKKPSYELVSGTRNVVLNHYKEGESTKPFRFAIHDSFDKQLHHNEVIYYEIVGWEDNEKTIMGSHNFSSTREYKDWGNNVIYAYNEMPGTFSIYVYRITTMVKNSLGMWIERDLTWPQVKARAQELGVNYVPEIHPPLIVGEDRTDLLAIADSLADGPDIIDPSHPREGVVLHILTPQGRVYALKHKGMTFKVGEGIATESDDFVDLEEIS